MIKVKILGRVASHAEPLHDAPVTSVPRDRDRDDLIEAESAKAVVGRGARRLQA